MDKVRTRKCTAKVASDFLETNKNCVYTDAADRKWHYTSPGFPALDRATPHRNLTPLCHRASKTKTKMFIGR